ncbi:ribonuclease H-like domain-containing protein [Tanacetum coccineum]
MVTHYRVGTNRHTQRYTLSVSTISPIPKSYNHAFQDPHWYLAMLDEYSALIKNNTWILVPRPSDANIVHSLWLFRRKYNIDGTLNRYKARLVANGSTQLTGIDVDETFSPVVKPATIHTVLSLALSRHWHVHQLDVKNRSLYGLKQAPRAWFQRFAAYVARVGFIHSRSFLKSIIATLHVEFSMFLSQQEVCFYLLERAGILTCNPVVLQSSRALISSALKRSLRYIRGTMPYGLQVFSSTTSSLVAYSDADWAGCPTTRRSTSGYCVFLGNNLLLWSSKRQVTLYSASVLTLSNRDTHILMSRLPLHCSRENLLYKYNTDDIVVIIEDIKIINRPNCLLLKFVIANSLCSFALCASESLWDTCDECIEATMSVMVWFKTSEGRANAKEYVSTNHDWVCKITKGKKEVEERRMARSGAKMKQLAI